MSKHRSEVRQIAFREWLILSLLLLILTAVVSASGILQRSGLGLYDRMMQLDSRPAREDILIVAIDDYSLNELGKWPWPRQHHAALIRQLSAAKPLAIGMDVLFTEADNSVAADASVPADQTLAMAMKEAGNVVIPITSQSAGRGLSAAKPAAQIAAAARQAGHIHIELDEDGVARSVFLREGTGTEWWPHFSLALKNVGQNIASGTETWIPGSRLPLSERKTSPNQNSWLRDYHMQIPYSGGAGHFTSVPYVAVLRGEVPASFIQGKYVLVGPTATGMADSFPTPVTGNDGVVSGIEINANILASLLEHRAIEPASVWLTAIVNLIPVLLAMCCLLWLTPRKALIGTTTIFVLTVMSSGALLHAGHWINPAPALLSLIIAYPLWSWRRLEAAIRYLGAELHLLEQEPDLLPEFQDDKAESELQTVLTDKLEKNIQAVHDAASRVRNLRQFVTDSLASLPDATLVTTTDGNVVLSNQPARAYFAGIGIPQVNDALVPYLFAKMSPPVNTDPVHSQSFSWWDLLDLKQTRLMAQGIEVRDPAGKDLLIKSAPCYDADKHLTGWIVSMVNITAIRAAERSRDETLHFISHDMRGPQASILALLEMQKDPETALDNDEFMNRIERASRITLGLADNFVQLARAESQDYRFEEVDFQDMLIDATEEMWSLARSKKIRIRTEIPEKEFPVRADRSLMTRVLTNLISNAVKYSPHNTTITCKLELQQDMNGSVILCHIADQGYGIPRAEQSKLFQRFQRFKTAEQPKNDGVGLGMVFVKAVIDRHMANISFQSAPNEGTTFTIQMPSSQF